MDCSLPGSSVHGILQARILEWVAISFSRGSSWARDQTHVSCIDKWILYHWATREAHCMQEYSLINLPSFNLCLRIGFWENLPVADGTRVVQENKCKKGILRLFHSPSVGPGNSKTDDSWSANSPWDGMKNSAIVRIFPRGNWSGIALEENALVQEMFPVFEKCGKIVTIRKMELDGHC